MDKESFAISRFKSPYIGDDGAVVGDMVYSKDVFLEDVHFKQGWMSLKQIGSKAMLVNISDVVAMNAKPKYALVGVGIPRHFSKKDISSLAKGFKKVCKSWGIELIGGDTTSSEKLFISITIISKSKKPVYRKGMKKGHLLAYTGDLGQSLEGLQTLLRGGRLGKKHKFIRPNLRSEFFYSIAPYASSAIDISDGLGKELSRLSKINKLGFEFFQNLQSQEMCSGEEYEMLFSFDAKFRKKIQREAKRAKVPLNIFAKAVKGHFESPCEEHHFKG